MNEPAENPEFSQRDAFISLYNTSFVSLYGFIFARTGSAEEAEEILQETYASAWAAIGGFQNRSSGSTWITAIARRKIADHYRRTIRRERTEEPFLEPNGTYSDTDLEDVIIDGETRVNVSRALAALSPVHRYALVMKYLDGCSMKEISAVLKRTPKAVDGLLQKAKASFIRNYRMITGGRDNGWTIK